MKMKRWIQIFCCIVLLYSFSTCFGISDSFQFVIDTIGIPRYNVEGDEINEEIYKTYHIFAYSSPQAMFAKTNKQRFKSVPDKGLWTKDGGAFQGEGTRGEYYILGTSYSGSTIDNVYFPVDSIPESPPDQWAFVLLEGAPASWENKQLYRYEEQLQYMIYSNLLFDSLDFQNQTANSYDLVEYPISAARVGLDKMKLNTCSTWKTKGIITAKRRNARGEIRDAIFATKPMAADANVKAILQAPDQITIAPSQQSVVIPLTFGAQAIQLNENVSEKHIKEIFSQILVNGKEVDKISGSKIVNVDKNTNITVPITSFSTPQNQTISIQVKSYLYTEFSVDGLMQDSIQKDISIQISDPDNPNKPDVPDSSIEVRELFKQKDELVVSPLVQTKITKDANAKGLVQAGKRIAVKVRKELVGSTKLSCMIDGTLMTTAPLLENETTILLEVPIVQELQNSLKSWNYLRNETKNYFSLPFREVGERIRDPHILSIRGEEGKQVTCRIDSIDSYDINMNYLFQEGVTNQDSLQEKLRLEDWIKK